MQSRKVRFKSLGYLGLFLLWNTTAMAFIMYRLKGDDLEKLEEEAQERIKLMNLNRNNKDNN